MNTNSQVIAEINSFTENFIKAYPKKDTDKKVSLPAGLTEVLKKEGDKWLIAQDHISTPALEN
ncbi:MAG: hypothetical protein ACFE9T_11460 [Promethearchaeota archaeon]